MIEVLNIIFDNPFSFFGTFMILSIIFGSLTQLKLFSINHYYNKTEEEEES
jgi:hypothetical protein